MLSNSPISPTIPVVNLKRSRSFYEEKLGLKPAYINENGQVTYSCGGGTYLNLYERSEPTKADHTAATFEVSNVESDVSELSQKGVVFEEYDMPGIKTVNGIATEGNEKAAWFKDTEGNILCLHQRVKINEI
jgi:catechol 2,3-dioxygenase-like lactoylglutathione lyase family enzyme